MKPSLGRLVFETGSDEEDRAILFSLNHILGTGENLNEIDQPEADLLKRLRASAKEHSKESLDSQYGYFDMTAEEVQVTIGAIRKLVPQVRGSMLFNTGPAEEALADLERFTSPQALS